MTLSTQRQIKTYFHTQDKEFELPLEFITSKNDKYIVVQYVSAVYKDFLVGDLCFHSDIVQRNSYCDSFVMMANKQQTKYRKYKFIGNQRKYRAWFTDLLGNPIEPEAFMISFLLIY